MTRLPAIPPQMNALELDFAKLGSRAMVRIGRRMSNEYTSGVERE